MNIKENTLIMELAATFTFKMRKIYKNKNTGKGWFTRGYKILMLNGKQVPEHRLIWEKKYGKIPKGHQIHHINGDKSDNRIENLQMLYIIEHTQLHNNGFQKGNQLYKKRKHNRNGTMGKLK